MTTTPKQIRPGSELDYVVDWAASPQEQGPWLEDGETITSHDVTVEGPLDAISDSRSGGAVTAWVRCQQAAALGSRGRVIVAIVTSQGRKDSRSIELQIVR
jgi:hypothetical protein